MKRVKLLDCTLRDGAYIVDGYFGRETISQIIKRLQSSNIDMIECGWLKNQEHIIGSSFYHIPSDLEKYMIEGKNPNTSYVAMIDYDRYDLNYLPYKDAKSIDAIRVVFPQGKVREGMLLVDRIREKGYKVYLQAAGTLGYSDKELLELAQCVNEVKPEAISIVDTYGSMYGRDLIRILSILNNNLDKHIGIGFHSHNNLQLSFSMCIQFAQIMIADSEREFIIDGSLCGMGRGAGNAPTELIANFLNRDFSCGYDMNVILDTIDMYMIPLMKHYQWGYSASYMIAGMYGCHVNNVAYLTQTHRTSSKDMKIIFDTLSKEDRKKYDYDKLEKIYIDYQDKKVEDSESLQAISNRLEGKEVLVILPGKSAIEEKEKVDEYILRNNPIIVGINAILKNYEYDYLFFTNSVKYNLAKESTLAQFNQAIKIVTSNVKTDVDNKKYVINYNDLQKKGWKYFDNSMIMFLRLMNRIRPKKIGIAGFDGYIDRSDSIYASSLLEISLTVEEMTILQKEIEDMLEDFIKSTNRNIVLELVTKSSFENVINRC